MTITWSIGVGRFWKNDCREAGSLASKTAVRVEIERCLLEAFGIASSENDAGALDAGSPGGFQPDAGAAADNDDGLAEQFRFALGGYSSGRCAHDSSGE